MFDEAELAGIGTYRLADPQAETAAERQLRDEVTASLTRQRSEVEQALNALKSSANVPESQLADLEALLSDLDLHLITAQTGSLAAVVALSARLETIRANISQQTQTALGEAGLEHRIAFAEMSDAAIEQHLESLMQEADAYAERRGAFQNRLLDVAARNGVDLSGYQRESERLALRREQAETPLDTTRIDVLQATLDASAARVAGMDADDIALSDKELQEAIQRHRETVAAQAEKEARKRGLTGAQRDSFIRDFSASQWHETEQDVAEALDNAGLPANEQVRAASEAVNQMTEIDGQNAQTDTTMHVSQGVENPAEPDATPTLKAALADAQNTLPQLETEHEPEAPSASPVFPVASVRQSQSPTPGG